MIAKKAYFNEQQQTVGILCWLIYEMNKSTNRHNLVHENIDLRDYFMAWW